MATAPAISSAPEIPSAPAGLPARKPRLPGNPRIRPLGFRNPPSTVPTVPTDLPLAIPEWMSTRRPRKGGYPRTRGGGGGGCHSSLGSSGDISISHSGVSCGHRNVPHASVNHYTTSPDSSGLRRPPSRTLLYSDGSFPPRPNSHSDRLFSAAPAHPRTILLHCKTIHNNVTEPISESIHGTLPAQRNPTIT